MADITSTTSGSYGTGGTWVGGVAPGTGDRAIIAAGHTVTVSDARTVAGWEVQSNGVLAVAGSGVLTSTADTFVQGHASATTPRVTVAAGGQLLWAPAGATTLVHKTLNAYSNRAGLECRGTGVARCVVGKAAGATGTLLWRSDFEYDMGALDCEFADFVGWGTAVDQAIYYSYRWEGIVRLHDCRFQGCGVVELRCIHVGYYEPYGRAEVLRCEWTGSLATYGLFLNCLTSGAISVRDCTFDTGLRLYALDQPGPLLTVGGNTVGGTYTLEWTPADVTILDTPPPPPDDSPYEGFISHLGTVPLREFAGTAVFSPWTHHPAWDTGYEWQLTNVRGRVMHTGMPGFALSAIDLTGDQDISVRLECLTQLDYTENGVAFCFDDTAATGYALVYESHSTARRWVLRKFTASTTPATLGTPYADDVAPGSFRTALIEVRSTGLEVLIDGVSRITSGDTAYVAGGRVGLHGAGSSAMFETTPTIGWRYRALRAGPVGSVLPSYDLGGPGRVAPLSTIEFRVELAPGVNPGSTTITPASDIEGTFTPATVTLTNVARSARFGFTPAADQSGAGAITCTSTGALLDPPPAPIEVGYFLPERFGYWERNINAPTPEGSEPYTDDPDRVYAVNADDHYDKLWGLHEARDLCARQGWGPWGWDATIALAAEVQLAGGSQAHATYGRGLCRYYLDTGDPAAVAWVARWDNTPWYLTLFNYEGAYRAHDNGSASRPAAMHLTTQLDSLWLDTSGEPPRTGGGPAGPLPAHLHQAAAIGIEHCREWAVDPATRHAYTFKPFMVGVTARALALYWDRFRGDADATIAANVAAIPGVLEAVYDWIWGYTWAPVGELTLYVQSPELGGDGTTGWDRGAFVYQKPSPDQPYMAPVEVTIESVIAPDEVTVASVPGLDTRDDYYQYSYVACETTTFHPDGVTISGGDYFVVHEWTGSTRRIKWWPPTSSYVPQVGDPLTLMLNGWQGGDGQITEYPATGTESPAPDLNMMTAPGYAWLYWHRKVVLGDAAGAGRHRDRFEACVNGTALSWGTTGGGKTWNEHFYWGVDGLNWLERGDLGEWPAADAVTLEEPPGGLTGTVGEEAGPFRLSIPRGESLGEALEVTPFSSEGTGTFAPAATYLTEMRPQAVFRYTPAAADAEGDATVPIGASSTLADPTPLGLVLGEPPPPGSGGVLILASPAGGYLFLPGGGA